MDEATLAGLAAGFTTWGGRIALLALILIVLVIAIGNWYSPQVRNPAERAAIGRLIILALLGLSLLLASGIVPVAWAFLIDNVGRFLLPSRSLIIVSVSVACWILFVLGTLIAWPSFQASLP